VVLGDRGDHAAGEPDLDAGVSGDDAIALGLERGDQVLAEAGIGGAEAGADLDHRRPAIAADVGRLVEPGLGVAPLGAQLIELLLVLVGGGARIVEVDKQRVGRQLGRLDPARERRLRGLEVGERDEQVAMRLEVRAGLRVVVDHPLDQLGRQAA